MHPDAFSHRAYNSPHDFLFCGHQSNSALIHQLQLAFFGPHAITKIATQLNPIQGLAAGHFADFLNCANFLLPILLTRSLRWNSGMAIGHFSSVEILLLLFQHP